MYVFRYECAHRFIVDTDVCVYTYIYTHLLNPL